MSVTGFQRRRRMLAETEDNVKANEATKDYSMGEVIEELEEEGKEHETDVPALDNSDDNDVDKQEDSADLKHFTPEMVDSMDIQDVKDILEAHNIEFVHNTGEKKLKEKLKNEISRA